MSMVDPPHPGEFIREVYIEPFEVSSRTVAAKLKVSTSTLTRLLNGKSGVTPEMACACPRLWVVRRKAGWLYKTPAISGRWRQHFDVDQVEKLEFAA